MNLPMARPFLRWPGGKHLLSSKLMELFPKNFSHYYEPFLGGGSIFFRIFEDIKVANLSDINPELIITYNQIKFNVDGVIKKLKIHQKNHSPKYYYHIRSKHNLKCPIQIAARFIYLNKTCFNGVYRVNSKGKFNVSLGISKNPKICETINLMEVSQALQKARIRPKSFDQINPSKNAFIYCDPPYDGLFNQYTVQKFGEDQQVQLFNKFREWTKKGVRAMVSNSNTDFILRLYREFNIHRIYTKHLINCKKSKRPLVQELVITNY